MSHPVNLFGHLCNVTEVNLRWSKGMEEESNLPLVTKVCSDAIDARRRAVTSHYADGILGR